MSAALFQALPLAIGHSEHAYFTDSRCLLYLSLCVFLNTVSSALSDLFRHEESSICPGTLLQCIYIHSLRWKSTEIKSNIMR